MLSQILSEQIEGLQQSTHHNHDTQLATYIRFLDQKKFKDFSDKEIRCGVEPKMRVLLLEELEKIM